RARFAPPSIATEPSIAKSAAPIPPEERGALILSAAQDGQTAQEFIYHGIPRGRFTVALQQVLNQAGDELPAEQIFLRVKATMQATGSTQEPVLSGTKQRRTQTLWGSASARSAQQ